ncbi:Fur family transcriptional regulator [Sediminibacillus albus]|uniref:Fur family transcriptional regulator, zinc uptake regulator n=1 Tax=Sediminibacillus albus TaxID=407036 RepID=A0A1G8ZP45_9BACI|nr:Fur family transcriptional regulator [Sediminibacillus albus]SDK16876.1 Fur family transcriptional regulator, zinc uptake regulator [Sediminibacillus albus]
MNESQALNLLKRNGFKHTRQREKLLDIFSTHDQYLSVNSIWKEFGKDFPGASYDTVYRNLYTMVELEILETTTLEGEKYFRFHCNIDGHHHHFICMDCGTTRPLRICPIDEVASDLPEYEIANHKFEVYGKCPECR